MSTFGSSKLFPAPSATWSAATDIVGQRRSAPAVHFLDSENCDFGKMVVV